MDERLELAYRRLERARESLTTAENVLNLLDDPKTAANRTYYGVFHGMRSMLALLGLDSKKHSGIIAQFTYQYLRTAILNPAYSKLIVQLFDMRQNSDYDDFYEIHAEEVALLLAQAKQFLADIEIHLQTITQE